MKKRPALKKLVADIVAEKLRSANWQRLSVAGAQVARVVHDEGSLTSIVVIEAEDGLHYYEVTVKEKI